MKKKTLEECVVETLHDAFFIHQTKPPLTLFGDVYHEQKEREIKYRAFQPGRLSDRLKKALGIPATWRVIAPGGIAVYDDLDEEKPREGQILAQGTELTWDETSAGGDWIRIVRPVNGWIQVKDELKVYAKQVDVTTTSFDREITSKGLTGKINGKHLF